MTDKPVRVRYAPSPTGFPHMGNIRSALFNWLFARHHKGVFIIRIEDTDVARKVDGAVDSILDSMRWLGLDWDEGPEVGGDYGPYFQSQRLHLYKEAAEQLVRQGDAYYCYCSPERLEQMRKEQMARKQPPGYDRLCRKFTPEERAKKEAEGITPVVRFKIPLVGKTVFTDLLRGEVVFDNSRMDDLVLLKSDGYPTYHLANVVDDHLMEISHVMRAEEWLSSTPRHLLMYQAFGYEPPRFVHLPMILGTDRSKLSKRHGAVSITKYKENGYLPETMLNFLTLLGWSLDDKTEIFSQQELIDNFSLERVSRTAAIFNVEKLNWMNGLYIRKLTPNEFFESVKPFLMKDGLATSALKTNEKYVRDILPLVHERIKLLSEVPELISFFFVEELDYEASLLTDKKITRETAVTALEASRQKIEHLQDFNIEALEASLRPLVEEVGVKTGQLFGVLRTATTGQLVAPPLFETMTVLGKERCLRRINTALEKLSGMS
jgi:glutamyl-tRNA synthetase